MEGMLLAWLEDNMPRPERGVAPNKEEPVELSVRNPQGFGQTYGSRFVVLGIPGGCEQS